MKIGIWPETFFDFVKDNNMRGESHARYSYSGHAVATCLIEDVERHKINGTWDRWDFTCIFINWEGNVQRWLMSHNTNVGMYYLKHIGKIWTMYLLDNRYYRFCKVKDVMEVFAFRRALGKWPPTSKAHFTVHKVTE